MKQQHSDGLNASSFAWNSIGSILSAGSSFILLSCVTQAVGATDGGIFAFAFSSAQLLLTLGKYGVRSYQATDVTRQISNATYFISRVLTCIAMLIMCGGMIAVLGYHGADAGVIMAVGLLKMVDAVEDVYHGQLQLNDKLNVAGQLLALRNLLSMVLFAALIFTTKNIALTCWVTAAVSLVVCVVINHPALQKTERLRLYWHHGEQKQLALACLPLFVGQFLSLYIYNAPKYAIEMFCESEIQTYYNIIFMPAFAINLLSEFVFKPFLTSLARWWDDGEMGRFSGMVWKMIAFILAATAAVLVGTWFVGAPLLSLVFGVDILPYRGQLMVLMLGGGCGAVVYFLYNVLTSMRKQTLILINYGTAAVVITAVAFGTVSRYGITAAALAYVATEMVLCALMLMGTFGAIRKKMKEVGCS